MAAAVTSNIVNFSVSRQGRQAAVIATLQLLLLLMMMIRVASSHNSSSDNSSRYLLPSCLHDDDCRAQSAIPRNEDEELHKRCSNFDLSLSIRYSSFYLQHLFFSQQIMSNKCCIVDLLFDYAIVRDTY